jgi:hypothetical protein
VQLITVANFAAGVVDTGNKFAAGVADAGGKSLIPVVEPHLRISPRMLGKILNDPNVIFVGLGEDDSLKIPEAKNPVTLSL